MFKNNKVLVWIFAVGMVCAGHAWGMESENSNLQNSDISVKKEDNDDSCSLTPSDLEELKKTDASNISEEEDGEEEDGEEDDGDPEVLKKGHEEIKKILQITEELTNKLIAKQELQKLLRAKQKLTELNKLKEQMKLKLDKLKQARLSLEKLKKQKKLKLEKLKQARLSLEKLKKQKKLKLEKLEREKLELEKIEKQKKLELEQKTKWHLPWGSIKHFFVSAMFGLLDGFRQDKHGYVVKNKIVDKTAVPAITTAFSIAINHKRPWQSSLARTAATVGGCLLGRTVYEKFFANKLGKELA